MGSLLDEQRRRFDAEGYLVLRRFAPLTTCRAMRVRAVEIAREVADGRAVGEALVMPEPALRGGAARPEDGVGKIFRLHRKEPVFEAFARDEGLGDLLEDLVGPEFDCFLSQFIFKNPGALGQPWHQDAFYFPMEPDRQVGVWLAVTRATVENGPLHVLPGSHREPVHEHVQDRRPHAQYGYVEIVDHDMASAVPVLMEPGDLLLFDSHLMHRSTDNRSREVRAAMVFHYSPAGTVDRSRERVCAGVAAARSRQGAPPLGEAELHAAAAAIDPNRWMPVRRTGA